MITLLVSVLVCQLFLKLLTINRSHPDSDLKHLMSGCAYEGYVMLRVVDTCTCSLDSPHFFVMQIMPCNICIQSLMATTQTVIRVVFIALGMASCCSSAPYKLFTFFFFLNKNVTEHSLVIWVMSHESPAVTLSNKWERIKLGIYEQLE